MSHQHITRHHIIFAIIHFTHVQGVRYEIRKKTKSKLFSAQMTSFSILKDIQTGGSILDRGETISVWNNKTVKSMICSSKL